VIRDVSNIDPTCGSLRYKLVMELSDCPILLKGANLNLLKDLLPVSDQIAQSCLYCGKITTIDLQGSGKTT